MAGKISEFFLAWGAPEDHRDAMIKSAVSKDITYEDPRGAVTGADALCAYVAGFTANAPGAAAEVAEQTEADGIHDVRVRFFGEGWEQFGRYTARLDDLGRILQITGVAEQKT